MYRLLIVTGDQQEKDLIDSIDTWQILGLLPPFVYNNEKDAIAHLKSKTVDAIIIGKNVKVDKLEKLLDELYPNMPILQIESTKEEQLQSIKEVCRLLSMSRADHSDVAYDADNQFALLRQRWFKRVMSGMVLSMPELEKQMYLYRCKADANKPCVFVRLALSDQNSFLSERWQYGSDRLETALRNFFSSENEHVDFHVAVVSPQEARLLCYPQTTNDNLLEEVTYDYVQGALEKIREYLCLDIVLQDIKVISGFAELTNQG